MARWSATTSGVGRGRCPVAGAPGRGERHRLALDDGLASERLVALARRGGEEAVEVDLAVLEEVHQLMGERLPLLVAQEPVRQDHHLAHGS
jgi:hypothetical protein